MAVLAQFSDGISARSYPVLISVEGGSLYAHARDSGALMASWPLSTVSASSSFAVQTVLLSSQGGDAEIQLPTDQFVSSIRPYLERHTWGETFTGTTHRNKKLLAMSVVCTLALVALAFGLRLATHHVARLVPLRMEKKVFGGLSADIPGLVVCEAPGAEKALERLASQLSTPKERESMPLQIQVIRLSAPNAFAFLGGNIYFTSGLLEKAGSVDEVAAVLAHEIEHVAQRHVLTHVLDNFGYAVLLRPFSGSSEPAILAALLQLRYSRSDEAEADSGAGVRVDRAGYSRKGMVDFFRRVEGEAPKQSVLGGFLSSHPETGPRLERFASQAGPVLISPEKKRILKILNGACAQTN
jgi:beta-barrel assembly-enhancing protease